MQQENKGCAAGYGRRLTELQADYDLTDGAMGDLCGKKGIRGDSYNAIKNERENLTWENAYRIARYGHASPEWLYDGTGPKYPHGPERQEIEERSLGRFPEGTKLRLVVLADDPDAETGESSGMTIEEGPVSSGAMSESSPPYGIARVPCYSYAAADATRGAVTFDEVEREEDYILPAERVLMRVHGDSMADVAWDGQMLLLAGGGRSPRSGDLVVTMVEGRGCLFKRLVIQGGDVGQRYLLLSSNSRRPEPPLVVDPATVRDMRVVVGVIYE